MSADLYIIVCPERIPLEELRFYNTWNYDDDADDEVKFQEALDRVNAVADSLYHDETSGWSFPDEVWVGSASYAKASLLGDAQKYIPLTVSTIQNFYNRHGGVVRVTPGVVTAITTAFSLPNRSIYGAKFDSQGFIPRKNRMAGLNKARKVKQFLEANMGRDTFCDLW